MYQVVHIPRLAGGVACIAGVVAGGIAGLNSLYKEPGWYEYALVCWLLSADVCVWGGGGTPPGDMINLKLSSPLYFWSSCSLN